MIRRYITYGPGLRSTRGQNARCGGRTTTRPPRASPDTSTFRLTGSFQPCSGRTLTLPPRTATASASTSMPGLVTKTSRPPRTSAWICSTGPVITASVKSSFTVPPHGAYLHPPRDYPPAAPGGIPALVVEPDDVFSLRGDPGRLAGHLG